MRRLGSLQCVEQLGDDDKNWIILFHGFGADCHDLASLADVITAPAGTNWLFPNAPLEVNIGGGFTGRAWWQINMQALMQTHGSDNALELGNHVPQGLDSARKKAMEAISQLKVPWNKIILGGFSQGAMLATDLYLRAPETPKGLMIFSGSLIAGQEWKPLVKNREGQKYFMCHGQQDQVLPIAFAQRLETMLNQTGMKGGLVSFRGGHEIPPIAIQKASEYLKAIS